MRATGMTRKVDDLGRIVLPIEIRRSFNIAERDLLEIYIDGGAIILKKFEPSCVFCRSADNITKFKDEVLCASCLSQLKKK
jgi:transcriptional pleiotropic regulator of transition state genes